MEFNLIVVGGGAAGFYGAIHAAEMNPATRILILERSKKLLSKVRISGGGRCNVTHHCFDPVALSRHYPRGEKALRRVFEKYNANDTAAWFTSRGVELKTEGDGRMFPISDNSQTIIDCFLASAERLNIKVETEVDVENIVRSGGRFEVGCRGGVTYFGSRILIATGGNPKPEAYSLIKSLGHTIRPPIPSLFTFNDSGKQFADLMGVTVTNAEVRIAKTRFVQQGPLLITHWGLSGPAVIKLSAWAAEYLHSIQYNFTAFVSWIGPAQEEKIREFLRSQKNERAKQKILTNPLFQLPLRLWTRLCVLSEISEGKVWGELALRNLNKLLENLIRCPFIISGKTTFKEEFVTCGGVELSEIHLETMESKKMSGIFFAGEVLNIDGETGGFNFQAAWSTAYLAARAL